MLATHSAVLLLLSRQVVCLCVRPSVTLRYRDHHMDWNSSKIIPPLVSVGCSLFADPYIMDILQRKHSEILTGLWVGTEKVAFGVQKL